MTANESAEETTKEITSERVICCINSLYANDWINLYYGQEYIASVWGIPSVKARGKGDDMCSPFHVAIRENGHIVAFYHCDDVHYYTLRPVKGGRK